MATIIINGVTHREACTDAGGEADLTAYDASVDAFMSSLGEVARSHGFGFEVDERAQGAASYRVADETDYRDLEAAHEFMQSPAADFWTQYAGA